MSSAQRPLRQIRADYDRDTLVVYQAFRPEIALPAVETNKFQPPFSLNRMTWIKPSFLWMMDRSGWASKAGQERVLAIRVSRAAWESALSEAVLTSPSASVYRDAAEWDALFNKARVHVQWDPERSLRGAKLEYRSIQVGIGRQLIQTYVDRWVVKIDDLTPLVRKISQLRLAGEWSKAGALLPLEKSYPLPPEIARRLGATG
jgi:hypothetical protein